MVAGQGVRPLINEFFEVVTYQTYCAGTDRLIVQTCRVQTYYHRLLADITRRRNHFGVEVPQ